jgi:phosphatidylserine/phosphatidylglycerophosphate/cardiolipin synthase-like enzyme
MPGRCHRRHPARRGRSIGSINIDNRSFALNSELNVTFSDRGLADVMTHVFRRDLQLAKPVTLEDWNRGALSRLFYMPLLPLRDQL